MVREEFGPGLAEQALIASGTTDSDPVLCITKSVLNNTGETWFRYRIELQEDRTVSEDVIFVGTPTSDTMDLLLHSPRVLVFGGHPVEEANP